MENAMVLDGARAYSILLISLTIIAMTSFVVYGILAAPVEAGVGSITGQAVAVQPAESAPEALAGGVGSIAEWVSGN
jgi:hypothetical protein